jgi:hypothetical protein
MEQNDDPGHGQQPYRRPFDNSAVAQLDDLDWLTAVFVGADPAEMDIIDDETTAIARRRAEVAMLLKPGTKTYEQIAEQMRKSRTTIARDVKAIRQMYLRLAGKNYQEHLARELHTNTLLMNEAWDAWERSKGAIQETTAGQRQTTGGTQSATSIKKKQRDGNPAFLKLLESIWVQRLKLLGLYRENGDGGAASATEKLVVGVRPSELV